MTHPNKHNAVPFSKPKKKTKKQIWEELFELIMTGKKEKIEKAFTTAEELNFDLLKKLAPWEKVIDDVSNIDSLAKFFSKKQLTIRKRDHDTPASEDPKGYDYITFRTQVKNLKFYQQIQKLSVDGCEFSVKLPAVLKTFTNLRSLHVTLLEGDFPKGTENLPLLSNIEVRHIRVKSYDGLLQILLLSDYLILQQMIFSGEEMEHLPDTIGTLAKTKVEQIDFSANKLTVLPGSMKELSTLRSLDLARNNFSELPSVIGHLKNLETLHLTYNQLKEIPKWIGNLSRLISIDLSHNNLTSLPQELALLPNLQYLWIEGNPIAALPKWLHENKSIELGYGIDRKHYKVVG